MKKLFCTLFTLSCFYSIAQSVNCFEKTFKKKHPFYITQSLFLTEDIIPKQYSEVKAKSFFGENYVKHSFMPNYYYGVTLNSEGFKKLKKHSIYGNVFFTERYSKGVLGKNTFESKYCSPYYLTDTLQKNWKWQKIRVQSLISSNLGKEINAEISVQYTAQHKVNYQLPKPLLYKNKLTVYPTLGYKINNKHKIALGYKYQNSNDDVSIDGGSVASKVQLFSVTGVGNLTNNKGLAGNYQYKNKTSNTILLKSFSNFKNNKQLSCLFSLEKMNQQGYNNKLKKSTIFNYNEWISDVNIQLKENKANYIIFTNYNITYQNGKGIHKKPRVNTTFTQKVFQEAELLFLQKKQNQAFGIKLAYTRKKEANTIFANFYDFSYLKLTGNYHKKVSVNRNDFLFSVKTGFLLPTHSNSQFIKTNAYITNFIIPFTKFYRQKFYFFQIAPKYTIVSKKSSNFNIGFKTRVLAVNNINLFNELFIKMQF